MSSQEPPPPLSCSFCQIDMLPAEDGWQKCPKCKMRSRPYIPTPEERAETRAAFEQWRRLLGVVAELHKLGYECARIVPFIVDTAGGGDWQCIIAPAVMISASHGARIDEHINWWRGDCPPGRDFPYFIGRGWRGYQPTFDSAENLLAAFPRLAEQCLGPDKEYAEWYRNMLQATEPDGIVYADGYWDEDKSPALNCLRVLSPEGELEVFVPLPPPSKPSMGGFL